jgi:hypothetical protein
MRACVSCLGRIPTSVSWPRWGNEDAAPAPEFHHVVVSVPEGSSERLQLVHLYSSREFQRLESADTTSRISASNSGGGV